MILLQIKEEISGCIDFLKCVYDTLGFTFELQLSTRPEKFLGEIKLWDDAEKVCILFIYLCIPYFIYQAFSHDYSKGYSNYTVF